MKGQIYLKSYSQLIVCHCYTRTYFNSKRITLSSAIVVLHKQEFIPHVNHQFANILCVRVGWR